MRSFFKALAGMLLALLMVTSIISCSGSKDSSSEKEIVDLSVQIFDREIPGLSMTDGFQAQYIKEGLAEEGINVSFVTTPRWTTDDQLNVLMAAQEAPDLCITYSGSLISNYIKQGGLVDLGPYLDEYGPNLKKYLGDEVLQYGVYDGVQYAIPGKRPNVSSFGTFVRQDWLDKMGMDTPETTEEFYKMLVAMKQQNPGGVSNPIPFAFNLDKGAIDWTVHTLVYSFVEDMPEEEFKAKHDYGRWVLPGYKEGIRFLNKLNSEGLIYTDFALGEAADEFDKVLIRGNIGSFIWNYDMPYRQSPGIQYEMQKIVPDGAWVPVDPFTNYEGKHVKQIYNPDGLKVIVPVFHEDKAAEVIKYLDWMASDNLKNVFMLQNGEKGIHYLDESPEGIPLNRVQNDDLPNEQKIHWHDFAFITTGAYEYGSKDLNAIATSMSYPGFETEIVDAVNMAMTDYFLAPWFGTVLEAEAKYGENLKDLGAEIFVNSILCDPSEFDDVYDSLVEEYMAAGAQEIIDERYTAMNK